MRITHGMDVEGVEALGRLLQERGRQLDDIVRHVDRLVNMAMWSGRDRSDFLRMWPVHRSRLQSAAGGLADLGQRALRNAADQRGVSGGARGRSGPMVGLPRFGVLLGLFGRESLSSLADLLPSAVRRGGRSWRSGWGFMRRDLGVRASVVGRLRFLTRGAAWVDAGIGGYEQWLAQPGRDHSDLSLDSSERTARRLGAAASGAAVAGAVIVGVGVATAGAPVVAGAAAAVAIGTGANAVLQTRVGGATISDHLGELGADIGDGLVDAYRWLDRSPVGRVLAPVSPVNVAKKLWPF